MHSSLRPTNVDTCWSSWFPSVNPSAVDAAENTRQQRALTEEPQSDTGENWTLFNLRLLSQDVVILNMWISLSRCSKTLFRDQDGDHHQQVSRGDLIEFPDYHNNNNKMNNNNNSSSSSSSNNLCSCFSVTVQISQSTAAECWCSRSSLTLQQKSMFAHTHLLTHRHTHSQTPAKTQAFTHTHRVSKS